MGNKKRGQVSIHKETLMYWIIAIAVLVIMVVVIFILKDKAINAIEYLKNLLRFGK